MYSIVRRAGNPQHVRTHTWQGEDRVTLSTHTFQEEVAGVDEPGPAPPSYILVHGWVMQ